MSGTLTDAQPGYPVLSGQPVSVSMTTGGVPVPVATGKTDSQGKYSISFIPPTTGSYQVTTSPISQIVDSALSPPFGNLLSPAATTPVHITVHSAMTALKARNQGGQALIFGSVSPSTGHVKATVTIMARKQGSNKGFKKVATHKLASNDANWAVVPKLGSGKWLVEAKYQDPKAVVAASPRTVKVTVGGKPKTSVSFSSVKVAKSGSVTLSGKIKPGAVKSGATIKVLAMKTAGGPAKFGKKATVKVKSSKTKFTAHFKLEEGLPLGAATGERSEGTVDERFGAQDGQRQVGRIALVAVASVDQPPPRGFPGAAVPVTLALAVDGGGVLRGEPRRPIRPSSPRRSTPRRRGTVSHQSVGLQTLAGCPIYGGSNPIYLYPPGQPYQLTATSWTLSTVLTCGLKIPSPMSPTSRCSTPVRASRRRSTTPT